MAGATARPAGPAAFFAPTTAVLPVAATAAALPALVAVVALPAPFDAGAAGLSTCFVLCAGFFAAGEVEARVTWLSLLPENTRATASTTAPAAVAADERLLPEVRWVASA